MFARWKHDSEYTGMWVDRCRAAKVSPQAVFKVVPHEIWNDTFRILTNKGLRLVTVTSRHIDFVTYYPHTTKTFKDYL